MHAAAAAVKRAEEDVKDVEDNAKFEAECAEYEAWRVESNVRIAASRAKLDEFRADRPVLHYVTTAEFEAWRADVNAKFETMQLEMDGPSVRTFQINIPPQIMRFLVGLVSCALVVRAVPTTSPSTSTPSASPASCDPPSVTCCFSVETALMGVYVGGHNLTALVVPQSGLGVPAVTKTLTFPEPPEGRSVFALKGYEYNEILVANAQVRCVSTDPTSGWNMDSALGSGETEWRSVVSSGTVFQDVFPPGWETLGYAGLTSSAYVFGPPHYPGTLNISATCAGNVYALPPKVRVNQTVYGRPNWALRKIVDGVGCTTNAPSSAPTSTSPSSAPSPAPTYAPEEALK